MGNLNDYGLKDRDTETLRLEDIAGENVVIQGCDIREGNWGDFAIMSVLRDSGELVPVISGGVFVVDALKDCIAKGGFPVDVCFEKRGRTWIF